MTITAQAYPDDVLFQKLAETEDEWAKGAALYGPGGLLDAQRKIILSIVTLQIRDRLNQAGAKATDKVLDAEGHADVEYQEWVDSHVPARATWLALDAKRDRWYMEIKSIQARTYDAKRNGG